MRNPARRNRNIGTPKQGYSKDNQLVVPSSSVDMKFFYERLGAYKVVERVIKNHKFKFVVESTRNNSFHACTIDDIVKVLNYIPSEDYGELELIILRQPTKKEENLKPAWGRLIYSYEFKGEYLPAIIIETIDLTQKFKWSKKLNIDSQKELERLKEDGHNIIMGKRFYEAEYKLNNIRSTQLYRTLPHEFGHYVHYLEVVKRPLSELKVKLDALDAQINYYDTQETNPLFKEWDLLDDEYYNEITKAEKKYFSIPKSEKEVFAHTYADKLEAKLETNGIIPFDRMLNEDDIIDSGLSLNDFKNN
ncbi:hypothetical protein [Chondrinema litorale]|uniref:hypothetical protein n=1 Tax=Chondrinema litorale TaxID=2994555 RepID=UPI002542AA22|nr:hypothetical protein [Chondrinema litorale]UZS00234.1 hypothetical protein OQ292_40455 [Chondrinema litorale]